MYPPIPGFPVRVAAKYLDVSRDTVFRWLRSGDIRGETDVCGQLVIPYDELVYKMRSKES